MIPASPPPDLTLDSVPVLGSLVRAASAAWAALPGAPAYASTTSSSAPAFDVSRSCCSRGGGSVVSRWLANLAFYLGPAEESPYGSLRRLMPVQRQLQLDHGVDCGQDDASGTHALPIFAGTYAEACARARADLKPLLVYIHAPEHPAVPAFVRVCFRDEAVCTAVRERFVFWAASVHDLEGLDFVTWRVRCETFPLLLAMLVHNRRGDAIDVLKVEGAIDALQLARRLVEASESTTAALRSGEWAAAASSSAAAAAAAAADDASQRQRQRDELAEALQRAEEADRALERAARERDELEAAAAEAAARAADAAAREADAALLEAEEYARRVEVLRAALPAEPEAGDPAAASLKVTLLSGEVFQRRVLKTDRMQVVYDAVMCHDAYDGSDFRLVTTFPPRQLLAEGTVGEYGLYPRAAVIAQKTTLELGSSS